MTNRVLTLLRVQFRLIWRGYMAKTTARSKWGFLLLPLMLLAFAPMVALFGAMYVALYAGGSALGQAHVVITFGVVAGQLMCLMFGVFYVISAFYFAKDLRLLVPLPIRPGEIVLSKFISVLAGEYLSMAPVVAPALVVYGLLADVSWTYIPFALVIYVLLPVLPLVIASLFSLVLMRVTNLRRNRDLWRVVGALFGVGLAVGFNVISRFSARGAASPDQMRQFLESRQALVDAVSRYFPPSVWATDALRAGSPAYGALSFLLFVAVGAVALYVMAWAAEKMFFGGLVGGEERKRSSKVLSQADLVRETGRTRSPLWALLQREVKMLNRTPSFLMNALMPFLAAPFFIVLPMLQGGATSGLPQFSGFAGHPLIPVIAVGVVMFMNSMSALAPTAISREGKYFWISRSIPVAPHVQIHAKVMHTLIFSSVNLLLALGAMIYFKLFTPLNGLYVVVIGMAVNIAAGYAGLLIDILHPSLKWTDPQQAMKGNMNGLFSMLAMLVIGAVAALVTVLLYNFLPMLMMPGLFAVFAGAAFGLSKLAGKAADLRFAEIED